MFKDILKKSYDWVGSALGIGFKNGQFQFLLGGQPTASGITVTPDSALKTIAVQRCVSLLSGALAMAPVYGYRVGTRREYQPTPVEKLFNRRANPEWSGFTYRCYAWQQVFLWGGHFARIARNKQGEPIALWPYPASQMARKFTEGGKLYYERSINGKTEVIPGEAVFYLPYIIVDENGNGLSVITAHAESIGANQAAQRHSSTYFKQGARLSGVLKAPGALSDEAYNKLREAWNEVYANPDNAHKTAILEEGVDFTPIAVNPQDSQLLETQVHNDEQVAMMFGTPPSMIGLTSKSTSWGTGIEQQVLGWQKFTLGPLATQLQACAQMQLLPSDSDVDLRHDWSELLKPDINTLATALGNLHRGGLIKANEGRELLDYDDDPDGNKLLVQMQMVPIADAGKDLQKGAANATNPSV